MTDPIQQARSRVASFVKGYRDLMGRDYATSVGILNVQLTADDLRVLVDATAPSQRLDQITTAPARSSDPATSKEAARRVTPVNSRGAVLLAFVKAKVQILGDDGALTADGAVRLAGLTHQRSPWKRVSELRAAGLIEAVGTTRAVSGMTVETYRLTGLGMAEAIRVMPTEVGRVHGSLGVRG